MVVCVHGACRSVHVDRNDADVNAGGPRHHVGVREETELCHVSHTPDSNSFEEEIDQRAQVRRSAVVAPRRYDVAVLLEFLHEFGSVVFKCVQ